MLFFGVLHMPSVSFKRICCSEIIYTTHKCYEFIKNPTCCKLSETQDQKNLAHYAPRRHLPNRRVGGGALNLCATLHSLPTKAQLKGSLWRDPKIARDWKDREHLCLPFWVAGWLVGWLNQPPASPIGRYN